MDGGDPTSTYDSTPAFDAGGVGAGTYAIQLQLRRGTAAQWSAANTVLAQGEIGLVTDLSLFKMGNGTTAWNSLGYGGLTGSTGATGPAGSAGMLSIQNNVTGRVLASDGTTNPSAQANLLFDGTTLKANAMSTGTIYVGDMQISSIGGTSQRPIVVEDALVLTSTLTANTSGLLSISHSRDIALYTSSLAVRGDIVAPENIFNAALTTGVTYDMSSWGASWSVANSGSRAWAGLGISASGKYQTAVVNPGFIYTSSDYGTTWTPVGSSAAWSEVAVSGSGKYQVAAVTNGNLYTSIDYGVTWTANSANYALGWTGLAISATGQYQAAAVTTGNLYISVNYGVTWTSVATSRAWISIAVSASGQFMTAAVTNGNVYTSNDYGQTWTLRSTAGLTPNWIDVVISASGQYQTAIISGGTDIYVSSDYGTTWASKLTTAAQAWRSVAMSATGQYQMALITSSATVYVSKDFGQTWQSTTASCGAQAFDALAISASGQYTACAVSNGYLWLSVPATTVPDGLTIYSLQSTNAATLTIQETQNNMAYTHYLSAYTSSVLERGTYQIFGTGYGFTNQYIKTSPITTPSTSIVYCNPGLLDTTRMGSFTTITGTIGIACRSITSASRVQLSLTGHPTGTITRPTIVINQYSSFTVTASGTVGATYDYAVWG